MEKKKIKEIQIFYKTNYGGNSLKKLKSVSFSNTNNKNQIKKSVNTNTNKLKILEEMKTVTNTTSKENVPSNNNSPRKKSEFLNRELDKVFTELMKKKDKEEKKSTELNSRNKNKVLDSYVESKTLNMANNINIKNISFFKNENKITGNFNSPYSKMDSKKLSNQKLISNLKSYQKLAVKKNVNKSYFIPENSQPFKINMKTSTTELKRIMSPLKVKVDLNVISFNDDKNVTSLKKRLTVKSERTKLSRSFNTTDLKFNNYHTRNKKNSNLNFNSFDNEKGLGSFKYKTKDNYYCQTETRGNDHKNKSNPIILQKNSMLGPSILNSSLNMAKQNFNFLNENLNAESFLEHKKSTKDLSTKEMTLQKNDVESIEDMHFMFVKFMRQSKVMEREANDLILRTSSPESKTTNRRINEGV